MTALRRAHPVLAREQFYTDAEISRPGAPDRFNGDGYAQPAVTSCAEPVTNDLR